jgi:type III secretion protein S
MQQSTLTSALFDILWNSALVVGPPLIVATIIAFVIGLAQAVTQTQEQTLPQTVKIVVIALMLLVFGSALVAPLYTSSLKIFSSFYLVRN